MADKNGINVLLLNMSTFPKNCEEHSYRFEDKEYKAKSQLQPITKLLLDTVGLQKIVIMATEATLQVAKGQDPGWEGMSPCEYYLARVKEKKDDVEAVIVEKSMPVTMSFYWDVIQAIKGDGKETVNLYMDMQGGDRSAITQTNAIVSLLSNQGVNLCDRYAIDFHPLNEVNHIRRVNDEYRIYDLLSAMEIFRRYGRGLALQEFLESKASSETGTKDEEIMARDKRLIETVVMISDAIRLCDMDGFETALGMITVLKETFAKTVAARTEFDLVFDDIYDEYEEILPEEGKSKIVKQIVWCRKKGLLQQALTLIEAKMSKVIYDRLIECNLDVSKKVEKRDSYNSSWCEPGDEEVVREFALAAKDAAGKSWEPLENYCIDLWDAYFSRKTNDKTYYDRLYEKFIETGSVTVAIGHIGNEPYMRRRLQVNIFNKKKWERIRLPYELKSGIQEKRFNKFMLLHCFLKKQRNLTNHSGQGEIRCDAKQIEKLIDDYLKRAEEFGLQ